MLISADDVLAELSFVRCTAHLVDSSEITVSDASLMLIDPSSMLSSYSATDKTADLVSLSPVRAEESSKDLIPDPGSRYPCHTRELVWPCRTSVRLHSFKHGLMMLHVGKECTRTHIALVPYTSALCKRIVSHHQAKEFRPTLPAYSFRTVFTTILFASCASQSIAFSPSNALCNRSLPWQLQCPSRPFLYLFRRKHTRTHPRLRITATETSKWPVLRQC